ncbi:MAG TPA: pirin family protein [Melioribacteraceae bacterium]|nr:pirin family protein [Melioribacteraceae bacterium]
MLKIIKSDERGKSKTDWLFSRHSFSFNNFYNPNMVNFGPIRVINDDYIKAGAGFDTHPHKNMEIITYVLEGALQHKDSTGTDEIIYANEFQKMSAGSGIFHSEFNPSNIDDVHLLQIWIFPKTKNLPPSYDKLQLKDKLEYNKLVKVASNNKDESIIFVDQDIEVYIAKFDKTNEITFNSEQTNFYIFNISGNTTINNIELHEGDALEITDVNQLEIVSSNNSNFILFNFNN